MAGCAILTDPPGRLPRSGCDQILLEPLEPCGVLAAALLACSVIR
jgi:hypothetical protein